MEEKKQACKDILSLCSSPLFSVNVIIIIQDIECCVCIIKMKRDCNIFTVYYTVYFHRWSKQKGLLALRMKRLTDNEKLVVQ